MDNVLVPYLTARDEQERKRHLDELVTIRAAPLIRQVLRRRLAFYVSAQGVNGDNQDAEDLHQESMTRVVQVLHQLHSASGIEIGNLDLYVSRIAANTCTDFLRAKSSPRTRLKDGLRHLLKRHKDLVSWEHGGEILFAFATWRNTGRSAFSDQPWQDLETRLESFQSLHFSDEDARFAPLSQGAAGLL